MCVSQSSLRKKEGGELLFRAGGKARANQLTAEELTSATMMDSYGRRNRLAWAMPDGPFLEWEVDVLGGWRT